MNNGCVSIRIGQKPKYYLMPYSGQPYNFDLRLTLLENGWVEFDKLLLGGKDITSKVDRSFTSHEPSPLAKTGILIAPKPVKSTVHLSESDWDVIDKLLLDYIK